MEAKIGKSLSDCEERSSAFGGAALRFVVRGLVPNVGVETLNMPLAIAALDLIKGEEVLITDGPLCSAVCASSSVPGFFPPVERQGRLLVDAARHEAAKRDRVPLGIAGVVGALLFAVNWTGYAPDPSRWHLDRATARLRAKNDPAALIELDAAIVSDDRNANAYRQRGLLLARQGDATRALGDLQPPRFCYDCC